MSKILTVFSLLAPLFIGIALIGSVSYANPQCQEAFEITTSLSYGRLKPYFKHDSHYSVEAQNQSPVLDQCALGTCHLYSWVSQLENSYKLTHGQDLRLSPHFLVLSHWLTKSLLLLNPASKDAYTVSLGENVGASRNAILMFGLIPDEAWTGNRNFQEALISGRANEYIKNIVARAKLKVKSEPNSEKAKKILDQARLEIFRLLTQIAGVPPAEFSYQNKTYSPRTFQQEFFPELSQPIAQILISSNRKAKITFEAKLKNSSVISVNIDHAEEILKAVLDKGQNAYLSYDHQSNYVDKTSGIMSISAFEMPSFSGPLSRSQRKSLNMPQSGHAVQVVGYDLDPSTGKVIKWKIKNSWSAKSGDQGYYHMYRDYFRSFALSINILGSEDLVPKIEQVRPTQLGLDFDKK